MGWVHGHTHIQMNGYWEECEVGTLAQPWQECKKGPQCGTVLRFH
jgi:hypothetical protein